MENELLEDSQTPQDELIDDSETIEQVDDETTIPEESPEDKIAKLDETNKKLFARAKRAEEELKAYKKSSIVAPKENNLDVVDQRVKEILEEKELDAIDISDAAKGDLKAYAKAKNLTSKQVKESDYFKFLKQKEDEAKKVEEASIGKGHASQTKKDFSKVNPAKDFDLSTKEGQEGFEEYKNWLKNQ
jgi:hypothetical protein